MPYPIRRGGGSSSVRASAVLPSGYEWREGSSSELELWKVDVIPNILITSANVGEFDVNGSLRAALNTVYLEQSHAIKSAGEEVVFENLESKVFYTPIWQFTSEDGQSVGDASVLVEAASPTDFYQNGAIATLGTSVDCADSYAVSENGTVYVFQAISAEDYSGKVKLEISNSLGDAVFRLEKDVTLSSGDTLTFDNLLYRVRVGNVRSIRITKSDGSLLQVRSGTDQQKPWLKAVYRGFEDRAVVHLDASGKIPTSQLPTIDSIDRRTVPDETERLALPLSDKFRIVIQSDIQRQFYLDPNLVPSVTENWVDGGSVASSVASFNGRTGNVTPEMGDYSASQVGAVAAPVNDGARRVLLGSTPTIETIVNNLTSTSTTNPLSAAQGKALNDNKVDKTHTKRGYDLVSSTQPQAIYRDKFLTSGVAGATITATNVPWVYANIDAAESSLPYWIQELTTFFKNLENDTQFDQLIGGIPAQFSIPQGSWGVQPSASTDMDNATGSGTTYASESFEFIVGRNPAGTEVYTFGFTFAQYASATYGTTCLYPFRMIYQTTRGVSSGFAGQTVSNISGAAPKCTARGSSFSVSSYLSSAFPLMYEPITLEISK